ncbi:helix-turn-helix domain-containing protein [Desulfovibrio sp.]|uniref:helix-turn-helix domain-containing protein n=1 Tax=Desulfovibrio TaxID=872 RepID=UPI003446B7BD
MRSEPEIYQEISEVLERRRVDLKMSKRQLAKLTDITPVYLREVLRGDRKPSVVILISLCSALNLKMSDIFLKLERQNKI